MDPLALLSGSEASGASDLEAEQEESVSGNKRRRRNSSVLLETHIDDKRARVSVDFADLQSAGYQPTELLDSEQYQRDVDGQESRRPQPSFSQSIQELALPYEPEEIISTAARPPPPVEVLTGGTAPTPWSSFESLPSEVLGPLAAGGLERPTPIQAHALPLLIAGQDLIGIAPTGSGKTLAYLLPGLVRLEENLRRAATATAVRSKLGWSPLLLVLAPTRELVCQIEQQAERFRKSADVKIAPIYGGAPRAPQLACLRARPELVVATPGRLNDFLMEDQASCSLHAVSYLVLDEADRMLDDGFEPQVRKIVSETATRGRQTAMFSATWPAPVRQLAFDFMCSPAEVRVGDADELRANADVSQDVIFCEEHEKLQRLKSVLGGRPRTRSVVFVATKQTCKDLHRSLRGSGPGRCEAIHGDRSQEEREAALAAFRAGEARILVATDVAGRGLDVPGVGLVINFDPPRSAEDYVHRIGRSGRAGALGLAVSLLTSRDREAERYIEEVMRRTGVPVPADLARKLCTRE